MKKCPYCAEDIQDDAIKCKHWGRGMGLNLKNTFKKKSAELCLKISANYYHKAGSIDTTTAMTGNVHQVSFNCPLNAEWPFINFLQATSGGRVSNLLLPNITLLTINVFAMVNIKKR